jgi:putative lipoprotein (rSAM/lipoprotein system)
MAPIKLKFLNSYNAFILFLVSFLGFSSACKKEDAMYLYGTLSPGLTIKGKIVSAADSKPIPDIIIEIRDVELVKTRFSDSEGNYSATVDDVASKPYYKVKFVDTDGARNGEFESLDTTLIFKDPVNEGEKWFINYTEQELNVKLKPKK